MTNSIPKVIEDVVNVGMCTGCGICTAVCENDSLSMSFNSEGFLVPKLKSKCHASLNCIKVCPFNPFPEKKVNNEAKIAEFFLETDNYDIRLGKYNNFYLGHDIKNRMNSSSGGLATYISKWLFNNGYISHVISVKEKDEKDCYNYQISSSLDEIKRSSKTRYYPVSYGKLLNEIESLNGNVLIVGVACFIKSVRLIQLSNPILREKINFTIGIICGGLKSKFYTDYLAQKSSNNYKIKYKNPQYREKNIKSTASDYSFKCNEIETNEEYKIRMKEVGDMWGTGLFKCKACDYCQDVTTELADISLGDAWLKNVVDDGGGNNIIITRSKLADQIIQRGVLSKDLKIEKISKKHIIESQAGSFRHRQDAFKFRVQLEIAGNKKQLIESSRINKPIGVTFQIVQICRIIIRRKSIAIWTRYREMNIFEKSLKLYLRLLNFTTRVHYKFGKYKR